MKHHGTLLVQLLWLCIIAPLAPAQLLFNEDFDYPAGDSVKMHQWGMTGPQSGYSYVNPVSVTAPGLQYPGYRGSGVGNATTLASTGQDVSRPLLAPAKSGNVYVFLMVRVSAARTSGDYFFHMIGGPATSSVFAPKLSVKATEGRLAFGISKRANASSAAYTGFEYGLDTTYLIVLKYRFIPDASTDDEVSLFVFGPSGFPTAEPALPTVGPVTEASGSDVDSLCSCALRQGSSSAAPTVTVDGIRVATSWESVLPIQLSSFKGTLQDTATVELTWVTQSEIDNYGFEVQRSSNSIGDFVAISGLIPGHNTTTEPQTYSFSDRLVPAGRWFYRLKSIAMDQSATYSDVIEVSNVASIATEPMLPGVYALGQNYPNPFNPSTRIQYTVAGARGQGPGASKTTLIVYDVLGREVATLVDDIKAQGTYEVTFDAGGLASGVYMYRLKSGSFIRTRSMLLLR